MLHRQITSSKLAGVPAKTVHGGGNQFLFEVSQMAGLRPISHSISINLNIRAFVTA
jgi:hypothetical protein